MPEWGEGLQAEVAPADRPLVVLLEQQGANQADDRGIVREDPDHIGAPLDLADQTLEGIGRADPGPAVRVMVAVAGAAPAAIAPAANPKAPIIGFLLRRLSLDTSVVRAQHVQPQPQASRAVVRVTGLPCARALVTDADVDEQNGHEAVHGSDRHLVAQPGVDLVRTARARHASGFRRSPTAGHGDRRRR
jgi:hypothetical protein